MATSILALLSLMLTGYGLYHLFNVRLHWRLNPSVEIGTGFFIASAIVGLTLNLGLFSVEASSKAIALICGVAAALLLVIVGRNRRKEMKKLSIAGSLPKLELILVLISATYLSLILINNMSREVFPWDAFSTWIYRAKAWVLTNQAVEFVVVPLDQWLRGDTSTFTLAAAKYPIAVSAISAFSSAVSGGWSDQLASVPWFFSFFASLLIMVGLVRIQHPESTIIPLIGGALLITVPILHLHGVLAGYADIWVMGTGGMGLASVCVWMERRSTKILWLGVSLLVLGCFWKAEGWLWLSLGSLVILLRCLWHKFDWHLIFGIALITIAAWMLQPVNLGILGVWGIDADQLSLGVFGTVALKPYNPLDDYLTMTVWRGSFLLSVPFYLFSLVLILLLRLRHLYGYVLMGVMVATAHGTIFGLSSYSEYAQIGTAINRVFLQTLPVLVVTITAAVGEGWARISSKAEKSTVAFNYQIGYFSLTTLILAISALPLTVALFSPTTYGPNAYLGDEVHAAEDLRPVSGQLISGVNGHQFRGADIPIGVARVQVESAPWIQPRYLLAETWMAEPETVSFYWINTETPRVHSLPIPVSGHSVIDTAGYPDFWQRPIREMGYLVQPDSFETTALGPITLSNSLFTALPGLFNHWLSPASLNHRLINMSDGHIDAPIAFQSWLSVSFILICLLGALIAAVSPKRRASVFQFIFTGASILWLIGSFMHLNQTISLTTPLLDQREKSLDSVVADGSHLKDLSSRLMSDTAMLRKPILAIGLDERGRFDAQRLPFMLLPMRAASITEAQLANVEANMWDALVVFGQDPSLLTAAVERLTNAKGLKIEHQGHHYVLLKTAAR